MMPSSAPPDTWRQVRLGSIGSFSKGSGIKKDEASSGLIPAVRYGELYTDHAEILKKHRSFIEEGVAQRSTRLRKGDILFAGSGETKEEIGKCTGFFGEYAAYAGGDIIIFRSQGADPCFLSYALNSSPVIRQKAQRAQGDAVVHIYANSLATIRVALPPIPEQQAIAEALSDADGLVEGLERLIEKKRRIKQGAMQDLLTAKRRLPGFSGEWVERKLGEIGYVKTGLTYSPDNVAKYGTLVLRSSNIQNERLAFENNVFVNVTVSEEATVRDGDLLICVRNGSRRLIGKTARIDARADGMAFGAFMSAFRSDLNDFLIWCFQSNVVQRQIEENLGATINQITNKTLKSLKVQLPLDDDERHEICRVLREMDAEVTALETRLQKARAIKEGMMQHLLTGRIRLV